ncbi:MAG: DegT/DnrJ/EryC1/StrS family aminotransferase [Chloroflexi bacterium]|nr:MAG: DegT/DnrJ/EryC1/StrS family aminotransferase [Chloroflexota bacterium]
MKAVSLESYIPIARPQLGPEEEKAVIEVLRSGQLVQGPRVAAFEAAFATATGAEQAVATSSGSTALFLALAAHGVGPGDEVITSPLTFIATANAIVQAGARPVFADVDETLNLDPARVEALISPRTKALLPVHLHGNPCDLRQLGAIAERHGLALVQDACQAVGASIAGRGLGSFGTAVYSLYATKNITTGEGGMVTTNDPAVAARVAALRHQAYSAGGGYRHDEVGYNYRLTEMQAAIGLCQLDRLEAVTSARRDNAAFYDQAVDGVRFPRPHVLPSSFHVYHQYVLRVPAGSRVQRDPLQSELDLRGIGTGVHYPVPVHCQQPYRELGADCPAAERASSEMLSIPVHPGVSEADRERVAAALAAL